MLNLKFSDLTSFETHLGPSTRQLTTMDKTEVLKNFKNATFKQSGPWQISCSVHAAVVALQI